jgi:hypothetical protein
MGRTGMIAAPRPDPANTGLTRFLNGEFRGPFHDQVAQPIVAVYKRGSRSIVYYSNAGPRVNSTGFDLGHVLLQPENAMGIPAVRVGLGHQRGHLACILGGNSYGPQRSCDEGFKLGD